MIANSTNSRKRKCIYCGRSVKKGTKEHIVPDTIGGRRTISDLCKNRKVCGSCNNGELSKLDRELCSRSPISLIAADELDSFVWQVWDVDHSSNNLLLEAKTDFKGSMSVFPQIVFEKEGPLLYCGFEELRHFGAARFESEFVRLARIAFHEFKQGKRKRLHDKRVPLSEAMKFGYRYPPRIFTRRPLADLARNKSFELQYLFSEDRRFALYQLDSWRALSPFGRNERQIGSQLPAIGCHYECGKVLRSLMKIAVNLLAAYCPSTPVERESFPWVIQTIMGEILLHPRVFSTSGFVYASDVDTIKVPNAHSFRLLHDRGWWHVYSSFFGGRIGSVVQFPGPNGESWRSADVVAPLRSNKWTVSTGNLLLPLSVSVEWTDPAKIIQSLPMSNVQSEARFEPFRH